MRHIAIRALVVLCLSAPGLALAPGAAAQGSDWPDWRGPKRDANSAERNLPERWSPGGENLLWRVAIGSRSAPVVFGDRVYLLTSIGRGETLQERLICFDADTGKIIWDYRSNVFLSDVPPHRIAWSSPAVDPATGNVFMFGGGGMLVSLDADGKQLWERSLSEDFGLVTTHGGRTVSPVIDAGLVIVSGVASGWGDQARASHRFFAFDKKTGDTVWVSSPGGRPYDTTYSPPVVAEVNGTRLLLAGGSDGAMHALKPQTGEAVWRFEMSKRGINTGAVLFQRPGGSAGAKPLAIVSHGEENLNTNVMGLLAAVDASAQGELGEANVIWKVEGFLAGYSSPVSDGQRVYQVDNGSNLHAFDAATGKTLWTMNLGTIQRASPVFADGKLYVGTENGKFYILRPRADGCDILDEDFLGTEAEPEEMRGGVAISRGRIFLATNQALYAIGKKTSAASGASREGREPPASNAAPAHLQVTPAEIILEPGKTARFTARLFDARGAFIRETAANWSLEQLLGDVKPDGTFTASSQPRPQAGLVKAAAEGVTGTARVRVILPPAWSEDFEGFAAGAVPRHWINTTGKYAVREMDGRKVLEKLSDNPATKRARSFFGSTGWHDYTVEADVRTVLRRRQMGDAGVVAQRYGLVLFGNHQRLELQPWQPETERTVTVPYEWKPDVWYRMKLRVENLPDGKVRARGKVWPAAEAEPEAWTIERVDPIGNRKGSAGVYADAAVAVYLDNVKVTPNK